MGSDGTITRQQISRARQDLSYFATIVGRPLEPWQAESVTLPARMTCITAPRQAGKSWTLAARACWQAFRKRRQQILVLSSTEKASLRILESVRELASHPLLNGSLDDDFKTRVTLSNGSRIESVTASQRAVRGASVDLLIIDEACWIPDDLLGAAALPTTAARPDARIILASAPWGDSGAFYEWMMAGLAGEDADIAARQWALADARWISRAYIEAMRRILPPLRFRAEVLGEWVGAGDAFFAREDILACVARYPMIRDGNGAPAVIGLDWGRQRDRHAIAVVSLLNDYGASGRPLVIVPWVETSKREYDDQFTEIADVASRWQATIWSETNGPGGPATELLAKQVTRAPVKGQFSTQRDKEAAYARLNMLLEQRAIVLPGDPDLLRQLGGVSATLTSSGGMRIEARLESIHDDLPDAVTLAVSKLPAQLPAVPVSPVPDGITWTETPAGVKVPVPFVTLRPEHAWGDMNGPMWHCPSCRRTVPSHHEACISPGCQGRNPGPVTDPPWGRDVPAVPAPAGAGGEAGEDSVPESNYWCQEWRRCLRCGNGFDRSMAPQCPKCHPGGGPGGPGSPRPPYGSAALPAAFSRALSIGRR